MTNIEMDWLRINCIDNVIHYGYDPNATRYIEHPLRFGEVTLSCWVQDQPIVLEAWDFVERILLRFLKPFIVDGQLRNTVAIAPDTCLHLAKVPKADMTWWKASCEDLVSKTYRTNLFLNIANPNQLVVVDSLGEVTGLEAGQQGKLNKTMVALEFCEDNGKPLFRPWQVHHHQDIILQGAVDALGHYRSVFYPTQRHEVTLFGKLLIRKNRKKIHVYLNNRDREIWTVPFEDKPQPTFRDKHLTTTAAVRDVTIADRVGYFTRLQYARTL